jgi:hypothetical protein
VEAREEKDARESIEKVKVNVNVKAKAGDAAARTTFLRKFLLNNKFCVRARKTRATAMNCDSVVFARNNQVRNLRFVKEVDSEKDLETEFHEFIRPDWLTERRVYTQKGALQFQHA